MQAAVRDDDPDVRLAKYKEFVQALKADKHRPLHLRDLLGFKQAEETPSLTGEEIDRELAILRRFVTGGMSLGALSREAHETLAIAMNRLGGASNSGEGGEDPLREHSITLENKKEKWSHLRGPSVGSMTKDDSARSKIRQIASGRFGVTTEYLASADQLEIKIAQGAKPGEGGQLPGPKVDEYISTIRLTTKGVTLISPPPHHDIYSIEDLAQLIFDLKSVNPTARVSVKLVSIVGVGTVACGVAKAGADVIQISGHDGGTGAAALTSIKHTGAPNELGIAEAHRQLVENGLRDRVTLRVDGGIRTGDDVVKLGLLGAEEFGFGTIAMVAAGCVMARVCHTNNCPVGVATQKPELRARFRGEPEDVVRYLGLVAKDVRHIVENVLGATSFADIVGRTDLLEVLERPTQKKGLNKAATIELQDSILRGASSSSSLDWVAPAVPNGARPLLNPGEAHGDDDLVRRLLSNKDEDIVYEDSEPRLVSNDVDRALGTRFAGALARHRRRRANTISEDSVRLRYRGSAGQSFGAFACSGMTLELEGDANDYVGKGLSGAKIIIRPPRETEANGRFVARDSVIVGNTCLYGTTSGELYAAGTSGDRFGVRMSGGKAVIEGAGEHLCEYMTGGVVVVLGNVGGNVGAGMTGGVAYVLHDDKEKDFFQVLNPDVTARQILDPASPAAATLGALVRAHYDATDSKAAATLLADWPKSLSSFYQVLPVNDLDKPEYSVFAHTSSSSTSNIPQPKAQLAR